MHSGVAAAGLLWLVMSSGASMAADDDGDLLRDASAWRTINDGVMGGVSSSRIARTGDALRFEGVVRLEYNGGFASVRREAVLPAADRPPRGLAVTARGDGNRYRLVLYTRDAQSGRAQPFSYYAVFPTEAGRTTRAELDFSSFRASFRGRAVPEAPPVAAGDVIGVGFMITKAEHAAGSGPFLIELAALELLDAAEARR
jgi:monofunctional biosynthetic peptidoglycan transglycosylase